MSRLAILAAATVAMSATAAQAVTHTYGFKAVYVETNETAAATGLDDAAKAAADANGGMISGTFSVDTTAIDMSLFFGSPVALFLTSGFDVAEFSHPDETLGALVAMDDIEVPTFDPFDPLTTWDFFASASPDLTGEPDGIFGGVTMTLVDEDASVVSDPVTWPGTLDLSVFETAQLFFETTLRVTDGLTGETEQFEDSAVFNLTELTLESTTAIPAPFGAPLLLGGIALAWGVRRARRGRA